jgi:hypothetical protein
MNTQDRQNIRITGTATAAGGYYNHVRIVGEGKLTGDIDCITFGCTGTTDITGQFVSQMFKVHGTTVVNGTVSNDKTTVNGEMTVHGDATIRDGKINGQLNVKNNLFGQELKLYGMVQVDGDCEIDRLYGKGAFDVKGLLNAGQMDVQLYWPSQANEIGGEHITVKKAQGISGMMKSLFDMFKIQPDARLTARSIEGDDIVLENTTAQFVRGNNVTIGPGCHIEHVEYRNTYNQASDAIVNHYSQV